MEVKIKKLKDNAVVPQYAHPGEDAGLDLVATSKEFDEYGNLVYGVGLAFEIPKGYVGLLFPRSSISKKGLVLTNCVGVIDSGYRGEVTFKFKPVAQFDTSFIPSGIGYHYKGEEYEIGDRIGQMIILPYPQIKFVEVDELEDSIREDGGYGSTGA